MLYADAVEVAPVHDAVALVCGDDGDVDIAGGDEGGEGEGVGIVGGCEDFVGLNPGFDFSFFFAGYFSADPCGIDDGATDDGDGNET